MRGNSDESLSNVPRICTYLRLIGMCVSAEKNLSHSIYATYTVHHYPMDSPTISSKLHIIFHIFRSIIFQTSVVRLASTFIRLHECLLGVNASANYYGTNQFLMCIYSFNEMSNNIFKKPFFSYIFQPLFIILYLSRIISIIRPLKYKI